MCTINDPGLLPPLSTPNHFLFHIHCISDQRDAYIGQASSQRLQHQLIISRAGHAIISRHAILPNFSPLVWPRGPAPIFLFASHHIAGIHQTDQCGVIVFGSRKTRNILNTKMKEGYEDVLEYIPIGQPNAGTLAKLDALKPSNNPGDHKFALDALIVAIETQNAYLEKKKTWTRKIVIVTDGENPIEGNDLDTTIERIKDLDIGLTVVGIDFDDEEFPYTEEDKSHFKVYLYLSPHSYL
ncbi:hypothetical protein K438DRAFT_2149560 [Mycena galopus ATCC 62051]|nr:hypothetical protein K438DRAFT_2149560 [Mycena galopus ATCC 62051]